MFRILPSLLVCTVIRSIQASPVALPQAVTEAIAPSSTPEPGCLGSFAGVFGIAIVNISTTPSSQRAIQRRTENSQSQTATTTYAPVSQIGDGQIQGGTRTLTLIPVSQIDDGQIQNPGDLTTAATRSRTQSVIETGCAHDEEPDMPQRPQPENGRESLTNPIATGNTDPVFPPMTNNPPLALSPSPIPAMSSISTPSTSHVVPTSAASIPSSSASASLELVPTPQPRLNLVSCLTPSTLRLTLSNHTLLDAFSRTGYIASNYQFQFDGPPQSGALYTSGWSVCLIPDNHAAAAATTTTSEAQGQPNASPDAEAWTLALGGSTTFWQCRSGRFYNLYTENWAPQCNAVEIRIVGLVECEGQG